MYKIKRFEELFHIDIRGSFQGKIQFYLLANYLSDNDKREQQVRSMSKKVKLVRVDKRLLHATVALNWNNFINASYIAIVDPTHKDDPFLEKVLQLSFSNKSKVSIFSVDQLLEFLAQDTEEKCNVMIIFKNICALRGCE